MKRNIVFFIAFLMIVPGLLLAQSQNYPKVDYGVHPLDFEQALAGLTTAFSRGDANSAFGNPASIADVQGMELSISSMTWLVDTKYNSASFVKNFGALGAFGLNVIFLDHGDMYRTENREIFDEKGNSTGQTKPFMDLGTYTPSILMKSWTTLDQGNGHWILALCFIQD